MPLPMHSPGRRYIKDSAGNLVFTYASYGNYVFPAAISLKMSVEPVYDSTGRIPKWWKHTFTIETVIDPSLTPQVDTTTSNPVDFNMGQVRRMLSLPGQDLVFWNLGVGQNQRMDYRKLSPTGGAAYQEPTPPTGPITGNALKQDPFYDSRNSSHYSFYVDNLSDLNFGPKPQLLVCEPIGSSRAFRIAWTVECALPNCCVEMTSNDGLRLCSSPGHLNGSGFNIGSQVIDSTLKLTEFNYSMSWAVDDDKFTTYTIVGSVEFAGQLLNPNLSSSDKSLYEATVADTGKVVDALALAFYLRPGFKRNFQYDLSRDKRRIEFRITDTEIPSDNPYYPGIRNCTVKQSISGNPMMSEWNVVFSGDFEMLPGVPKYWGLVAFVALIQDRLKNIKKTTTSSASSKTDNPYDFIPSILPSNFSFEEDIYSRRTSFNFAFRLISNFKQALTCTRMFSNTPGSWEEHRRQMYPVNLDLKGTAQIRTLKHEPLVTVCRGPDVLLDICNPLWFKPRDYQGVALFQPACPEKGKNILRFDSEMEVEIANKIYSMSPMSWTSSGFSKAQFPEKYEKNQRDLTITRDVETKDGPAFALDIFVSQNLEKSKNKTSDSTSIVQPLDPEDQSVHTHMTTYSRGGPPEIKVKVTGTITSICYDIRTVQVRKFRAWNINKQEEVLEEPTVKIASVKKTRVDTRSPVPIIKYSFEGEYVLSNLPLGDIEVAINGGGTNDPKKKQDERWEIILGDFDPNPSTDGMGLGRKPFFDPTTTTTTYTDAPPNTLFNVPFLPGFGPPV